jgi:hypothetical protein
MQAPRQGNVQAVGQEGDEDVRLDARLELVKDRPDREVAFEVLERLLYRHQQQVMAPQLGRSSSTRLVRNRYRPSRDRACRSLLRSSR